MTTFFSYNALLSQRASGYKNTTYALAELIDNAFDADAKSINIVFLEKRVDNKTRVDKVLILDDGEGMPAAVLQGALQFGNTTNVDIDKVVRSKKKGKFGYGLPNASLSQCPHIDVYSWQKNNTPDFVYLNLAELQEKKSIEIPLVEKREIPSQFREILPKLGGAGTLVCWNDCDRLSHAKGKTIIDNSAEPLGRLYRHMLAEGKTIYFSVFLFDAKKNRYIEAVPPRATVPNDPLFLMEDTQLAPYLWQQANAAENLEVRKSYKPFTSSATKCLSTNLPVIDKCYEYDFEWLGKKYVFSIATSIARIEIQKPGIREGGNTRVGEFYGDKERGGNISFVRADREIAAGNFGFYKATDARHRWWSIEVRFNADADDLLGVHNNKQGIEFSFTLKRDYEGEDEFNKHTASLLQAREQLWIELSSRIEDARREAFKLVKEAHVKWDAQHPSGSVQGGKGPSVPKGTGATSAVIKKVDGTRPAQLPEQSKQELVNRLIEKYKEIPKEEIVVAVTALDKALVRACVLYAPTESINLWTATKVYDFLVVLINTKHEFYTRVLSEMRDRAEEGALTAVELFISSLAVEEEKLSANQEKADILEEFRNLVGLHLHNYIKKLPDSLNIVGGNQAEDDD